VAPAFIKVEGPRIYLCEYLGDPLGGEDDHLSIEITEGLHRQLLVHWHARNARVPAEKKPPAGSLEGFEAFWSAYPKKMVKAEAKRVWMQRGLSAIAPDIVAHVERMAQTDGWTKDAGKFVPMPTTYLNQRRWEDEVEGSQEGVFL